jgi:hypothetical protein
MISAMFPERRAAVGAGDSAGGTSDSGGRGASQDWIFSKIDMQEPP